MLSSHQLNSSQRAALFKKIYMLAKEKNKAVLAAMVADGLGISYQNSTVIELLAKEGDVESVEFLISEFHQSLNAAVLGYASGGYEMEMNRLIARGANIDEAVLGCARRNDYLAVETLLQQDASEEKALIGFAECGEVAKIQEFLTSGVDPTYAGIGYVVSGQVEAAMELVEQHSVDLAAMVCILAKCGFESEINKLVNNDRDLLQWAVFGYAQGGYEEKVNECFKRELNSSEELALQAKAASGYAMDGFAHGFKPLLAQVSSIKPIVIMHCGISGHVDLLLQLAVNQREKDNAGRFLTNKKHMWAIEILLKNGLNTKSVLDGYLKNKYIREANRFMQDLPPEEILRLCKKFGCLDEKNILKTLVNIEDRKIRKVLATAAQHDKPILCAKQLLLKADGINELMQKHSITYKQALAYLSPAVNHWIFKGQDWVRAGLPIELYLGVICTLTGCSRKDAIQIVDVANERLRERVVNEIKGIFLPMFRKKEITNKIKIADEHFEQRAIRFGSKRYDKS
ncbi:MAG: hypothetical protein ACYC0J_04320 [Gammaproteobacteria bacterium]